MVLKSHSLDFNDTGESNNQAGEDLLSRVTKKGKRGKGGKETLTQPAPESLNSELMIHVEHNTSFSTAPSDLCVMCDSVSTAESSIQCDICGHLYRFECCLVKKEDVATVRMVISLLGWSCRACRADLGREILKLRSDITDLNNKQTVTNVKLHPTQTSRSTVTTCNHNEPTEIKRSQNESDSGTNRNEAMVSYAQVVQLVSKSVRDVTYRKRNVIVSGLLEQDGGNDGDLFSRFCEEFLTTKPKISRAGTRRLGKINGEKPRRLLVQLESEAAVSELLASAPILRGSDDEYVSRNIFINADLTKEESRLAFERRQERRRRVGTEGIDNPQMREFIRAPTTYHDTSRPTLNFTGKYVFHNTNRYRPARVSNPSNLIECPTTTLSPLNSNWPALMPVTQTTDDCTQPIADSVTSLNPQAASYQPPSNTMVVKSV